MHNIKPSTTIVNINNNNRTLLIKLFIDLGIWNKEDTLSTHIHVKENGQLDSSSIDYFAFPELDADIITEVYKTKKVELIYEKNNNIVIVTNNSINSIPIENISIVDHGDFIGINEFKFIINFKKVLEIFKRSNKI